MNCAWGKLLNCANPAEKNNKILYFCINFAPLHELRLGQATELRQLRPKNKKKLFNCCINFINFAPLHVLRLGRATELRQRRPKKY
jgi:hypothetical protein